MRDDCGQIGCHKCLIFNTDGYRKKEVVINELRKLQYPRPFPANNALNAAPVLDFHVATLHGTVNTTRVPLG